jgi:hypothetical protein
MLDLSTLYFALYFVYNGQNGDFKAYESDNIGSRRGHADASANLHST